MMRADAVGGLGHMLSHPFMQNALLAGTAIALLCGLVGFFVVLQGQVFAGGAAAHAAYTGALAALAAGVDLRLGLFGGALIVGVALGLLGGRRRVDDVAIGATLSWILGLGVFFLALYTAHGSTRNGAASVTVLFGSIFGVSAGHARTAALIGAGLIVVVLAAARPLLFAAIDPGVAAARGVPVRLLGPLFLCVVAASAAEASQAVGAMLLVGLLAAPPAAAHLLTGRPWRGLALSGALAVAAMWTGLVVAYAVATVPPSFAVMAAAAGEYAVAGGVSIVRTRIVTARAAAVTG